MAMASQTTIVTVERVAETGEVRAAQGSASLASFMVDAVVETPGGAHPTSCYPDYPVDVAHIVGYLKRARRGAASAYLERYVHAPVSGLDYLTRVLEDNSVGSSKPQTVSEWMVAAILREIEDGDVLLEGIGTFLPTSAYMLAQATHAPRAVRLCPVGNVFVNEPHRLSLADYEFETLRRGVSRFTYWDVNAAFLPRFIPGDRGKWKEFLRPAQVDRTGRTNNVVIGPYERPKVRLPGAAGLPDGVPVEPALYMYVPRHDRNAFVSKLDFVSAPGLEEGAKPHLVVTNLAVMRFTADGALEVETIMPGASFEEVQDNTAFDLRRRPATIPFRKLSEKQLAILRDEIDPQSLRDLEFYLGEDRLSRIERIAGADDAHRNLVGALASIVQRCSATADARAKSQSAAAARHAIGEQAR